MAKKHVTVVLSGGGVRGLAHVGVLKALEQDGYAIKRIIGTSSGAIVAALYASCLDAEKLEQYASSLSFGKMLGLSFSWKGISSGQGIDQLVKKFTDAKRFEDLLIPLVVNATDLCSGEEVVFMSGDLLPALRASCAFPGIIEPFKQDGHLLVDGGIAETVAIHLAPKDVPVVVSDVTVADASLQNPGTFRVMVQALHVLIQNNVNEALQKSAHRFVRVRPDVREWDFFSFRQAPLLIKRGEESMQSSLPELRRLTRS